ncbi:hypothetical protein D047_3049B, partial [Vibrio parahaemolyticus VPTS-2010_2]
WQHWPR